MSEFTKIGGGHTRRTSLMYPADLWPNGVEIPLTSFEILKNKGIFNNDTTIVDTNGWDCIVFPIKQAVAISWNLTSGRGVEYPRMLYNDYTSAGSSNYWQYNYSSGDGYNGFRIIPNKTAQYIVFCFRGGLSNPETQFITFYYDDKTKFDGVGYCTSDNKSISYIDCHGANKVKLSFSTRGAMQWFGEDKNYLFQRGYGDEAGTYLVPNGAYYCHPSGEMRQNGHPSNDIYRYTYWLE